jgi:hypothetical protein
MMTRSLQPSVLSVLSVFGLALAVALPARPARAEAPQKYASTALGFTASFPYPVKEQVAPEGGGTAAGFDAAGIMYMVGLTPPNEEVGKRKTVKEQLDDGIAGAVDKVHGTVASQKDIKLGANPGREVEIDLQGGHATFRAYLVGAQTYLVGVVHKDGTTLPMPPADFFASFHLTGKPAKPAKK